MKNKIGVTQWTLDCLPGPESLRRAHELGFFYIHINTALPDENHYVGNKETLKKYQSMVEKYDIPIMAFAFNSVEDPWPLVSVTGEIASSFQKILQQTVMAAEILEVPMYYFPSFCNWEITSEEHFFKTAKILEYACNCAKNCKVKIVTENTLSAEGNEKLIKEVNQPNLKMLIDTQNPSLWNHSVIEIIERNFPRMINQVHIKDGVHGAYGNARVGKGAANLKQTVEYLYEKRFDGFLILENDYTQDALQRAKEDRKNLFEILDQINISTGAK